MSSSRVRQQNFLNHRNASLSEKIALFLLLSDPINREVAVDESVITANKSNRFIWGVSFSSFSILLIVPLIFNDL
jgi:hypothetical protein